METDINKMEKKSFKERFTRFHDKNYKLFLLIPLFLFIFCFGYMGLFYLKNHDFISKDVSLTGGTTITINVLNQSININNLRNVISNELESVNIREVSDLITNKQKAVVIETRSDKEQSKAVLEDYLGYTLTDENSSFEFTGSTLSENFYKQLLISILIAFVLMALVVFIQFKMLIPSLAVILSAFADIFMTLTIVNLLGLQISSAGIVAFLMLIGYSVDTDILLSNSFLRRTGELNKKIFESFKTGITMTLTSLFAVLIALIIVGRFSSILSQIFTILTIGLFFDLINTWITNVSIIKWYALKKQNNEV